MDPRIRLPLATLAIENLGSVAPQWMWDAAFPFTPEALQADALAQVGHLSTDFMWDMDGAEFQLATITSELNQPNRISKFAKLSATQWVTRALLIRLQLSYQLADDQRAVEIAARKVRRPIVIVGLPRTGTTALHRLLSLVPGTRPLRWFEAICPAGVPGTRAGPVRDNETDPRIAHTALELQMYKVFTPAAVFDSHSLQVDKGEECVFPMLASLHGSPFSLLSTTFGWSDGRKSQRNTYSLHRQLLQVIDWLAPQLQGGRWLLKAPAHLSHLEELVITYPDAHIIWLHRDPLAVAVSWSKMQAAINAMELAGFRAGNFSSLGPQVVQQLHSALGRGLRARRHLTRMFSGQLHDVHFNDLVQQPAATVARVAEAVGLSCDEACVKEVEREAARSQAAVKAGVPTSPATFGIDQAEVHRLFGEYMEQFDVQRSVSVAAQRRQREQGEL